MKSPSELQIKMPTDLSVLDRMKAEAEELLSVADSGQYTQAIVLLSAAGNIYGSIIKDVLSEEKTDEASLLQKLKDADDTEICYVLCMWKDKSIDIPSIAFRKMLSELNAKNLEALLFVMTGKGVSARKLSTTIK